MPQVKIYGLRSNIETQREAISEAIQTALTEAIGTAKSKKFQRFMVLEPENFVFPSDYPQGTLRDRTNHYTIIEIIMFTGRSPDLKKKLIQLLFQKISQTTDITPQDLEITIFEVPPANWGIRGIPGDEL